MLRIAKSLLTIVAVAAIATSATSAGWTDSTTVPDNSFTTGFMDISTLPTSALFTATNIYPGWSEEQVLTVINSGSVPLNYDIVASQSAGDAALYTSDKFLLKIGTISGGNDVYDGTVSGLIGLLSVRNLAAGNSENLYVTVSLDSGAGNGLQSLSAVVLLTLNATQP